MASALHWIPDSLYNYSIAAVVSSYSSYQKDIRTFHGHLLFDILYKIYKEGFLLQLGYEFKSLEIFHKLLKVRSKRGLLHNCFQALMDYRRRTAAELAQAYREHCATAQNQPSSRKDNIKFGLQLGGFLMDAGWFSESRVVFSSCLELCKQDDCWTITLECYVRLLRVTTLYCDFKSGKETFHEALRGIKEIQRLNVPVNLASIYGEFSAFFFGQSNFDEAHNWSLQALKALNSSLDPVEIINVLRQASKACVLKRQFKKAGVLIKQAMLLVRRTYGNRGLLMANTLSDYGFYLLNIDSISHSVRVYQTALDLHASFFGGKNLHVALAHGDLAYASYVHEYTSGRFKDARDHTDKALSIMSHLLEEDHFLLTAAKRVKEEIAIDTHDKETAEDLLREAEELHTSALSLTRKSFGELNIQTAKHYGNLGRLYQSMNRFEEARAMHLRAIEIKEAILGPQDYEVALSVGHLASLYNYDMKLYEEAEALYLRSIEIGITLYGEGYSGLEYDYRGLMRVYDRLGDTASLSRVHAILHTWKILRDQTVELENETSPLTLDVEPIPPEMIAWNLCLM
ncbi:amyloid protein-binding protein 2-like isoform X2 [Uloborus diversus]|uniref:amyloid protein-binding protein 2-like isoform X2 n=1 Tax=Uloborus diversus TaxID=327109 RepID=UPI0024097495|nr:amyloid protein-binding protein 2-like isoform X2 [Uloborus diversus]